VQRQCGLEREVIRPGQVLSIAEAVEVDDGGDDDDDDDDVNDGDYNNYYINKTIIIIIITMVVTAVAVIPGDAHVRNPLHWQLFQRRRATNCQFQRRVNIQAPHVNHGRSEFTF
jgi:hypothetical protein